MVCHILTSTWKSVQSLRWSFVRMMSLPHFAPCLYVGRLDRFICSLKVHVHFAKGACSLTRLSVSTSCMFVHSSLNRHIFALFSIHEHISLHASLIRPLVNLSFCMCSPSIIPFVIMSCLFVYLFLQLLMKR